MTSRRMPRLPPVAVARIRTPEPVQLGTRMALVSAADRECETFHNNNNNTMMKGIESTRKIYYFQLPALV